MKTTHVGGVIDPGDSQTNQIALEPNKVVLEVRT